MPLFAYVALAENGATLTGETVAASEDALRSELLGKGLLVRQVRARRVRRPARLPRVLRQVIQQLLSAVRAIQVRRRIPSLSGGRALVGFRENGDATLRRRIVPVGCDRNSISSTLLPAPRDVPVAGELVIPGHQHAALFGLDRDLIRRG